MRMLNCDSRLLPNYPQPFLRWYEDILLHFAVSEEVSADTCVP